MSKCIDLVKNYNSRKMTHCVYVHFVVFLLLALARSKVSSTPGDLKKVSTRHTCRCPIDKRPKVLNKIFEGKGW